MNLVRGIGRLLLGGYFVVQGAKAVKDPAHFAPAAEPIAQRFVPFAQKTLPPEASAYVPEDPDTLVRLNGALSVVGGIGMATGIGRRGGGYLAAASLVPHILAATEKGVSAEEKKTLRSQLVRNLALLGAALVVSQDTAGQPSLLWRAEDTRKRLAREAERAQKAVTREASRAGRIVTNETGHAATLLRKDAKRLKREAQLQAKLARKSIEGALT